MAPSTALVDACFTVPDKEQDLAFDYDEEDWEGSGNGSGECKQKQFFAHSSVIVGWSRTLFARLSPFLSHAITSAASMASSTTNSIPTAVGSGRVRGAHSRTSTSTSASTGGISSAAYSTAFAHLMTANSQMRGQPTHATVPDVRAAVFSAMLRFMYTGRVELTLLLAMELYTVGTYA